MMSSSPTWFSLEKILKEKQPRVLFVTGQRSMGKTYSFKEWAIRSHLRDGSEFCYLRRRPQALRTADTWFDDVLPNVAPDKEVMRNGWRFFMRDKVPEDELWYEGTDGKMRRLSNVTISRDHPWVSFGQNFALSTQQDLKGLVAPKVNKILYDEFILDNRDQRYLDCEVHKLLDMFFTIARDRKVTLVCFSNAGYLANPFFDEYNITLSEMRETPWIWRRGLDGQKSILFHYDTGEYGDKANMRAIANKDYADYAINALFQDSDDGMIVKFDDLRDHPSRYPMQCIEVWTDGKGNKLGITTNTAEWLDRPELKTKHKPQSGLVFRMRGTATADYAIKHAEPCNEPYIHTKWTWRQKMYNKRRLLFVDHESRARFRDWFCC